MSNCEKIGSSNIWCDQNIYGKVEVDSQWQKLIQVQDVGVGDHWDVVDQCDFLFGQIVEVQNFNLEKILCKIVQKALNSFFCDFNNVQNDSIQNIMGKGIRCQSMVLCQFNHIFVVVNDQLEFLLNCIGYVRGEPDVGF